MTNKLIVVGTGAVGGVGKSTLVQFLAEMHRRAGSELVVLLADDKGRDAGGSVDMADVLPGHKVVWLGAGPDAEAIQADPDALNAHWDQLDAVLAKHSVLVDLGANVMQRLVQFAEASYSAKRWAKKGVTVEVWVPFNNDQTNIDAAVEAMRLASTAFGAGSLVAVKNERDGAFSAWDGSANEAAIKALSKRGARVVTLPKCLAPLTGMEAARNARLSWFRVAEEDEETLAKKLGLSEGVAARLKFAVEGWIDAAYEAFKGLVPERPVGK